MKTPETIFITICILALIYFFWSLSKKIIIKKKNSIILIVQELIIFFLIIAFAWVWFVPMEVAMRGESPVCKFRLQVLLCDWHDYSGYGDTNDLFFRLEPKKYGRIEFYERIGGWQAYFGFKDAE